MAMLNRIFNSKTNGFTSAALLISFFTVLNGVFGLLRDRLLAGRFGASGDLDIYFAAFRIPDFLQAVLVAGGITAAFLPVFSQEFEKGKEKAFRFSNNILNSSLLLLSIICFLLVFFIPQTLKLVAPGFSLEQREKTVVLTRIMLLSPILFSLSTVFSGILHYFDKFLVYSLTPILYNLGIILGILFFVPVFGTYGLALGVILGALLHFLIQVPAAYSSGYRYSRILDFKDAALKRLLKLTIPSSVGSALTQINLIVITALCSTLIPGSIAIFNFSKNLQYFPVSIIGVPFAISAFPILSKDWALGDKKKLWNCFSLAFRQILFLALPLSVLIFVLRGQIVRVVLGAGKWGWLETRLTAGCLGIFSLSIFTFSLVPFFQKSFYSIHDTKTPTILQIVNVFLNIAFSLLFLLLLGFPNAFSNFITGFLKLRDIKNIQVLAFPLALTFSGCFQSSFLFFIFVKKIGFVGLKEIFNSLKKILILAFLAGSGAWFSLRFLAKIFSLITFWGVFFQTLFGFLFGALVYFGGAAFLGLPEFKNLKKSALKTIGPQRLRFLENLWKRL